jgi:hypothetical protein
LLYINILYITCSYQLTIILTNLIILIFYNIKMEVNHYIDISPEKITLTKSSETSFYESKLVLKNRTDKHVVFKVYINKYTVYSANPSTSFIPPQETILLTIKRLENVSISLTQNPITDPTIKDKLLIIAFPVDRQLKDVKFT